MNTHGRISLLLVDLPAKGQHKQLKGKFGTMILTLLLQEEKYQGRGRALYHIFLTHTQTGVSVVEFSPLRNP